MFFTYPETPALSERTEKSLPPPTSGGNWIPAQKPGQAQGVREQGTAGICGYGRGIDWTPA